MCRKLLGAHLSLAVVFEHQDGCRDAVFVNVQTAATAIDYLHVVSFRRQTNGRVDELKTFLLVLSAWRRRQHFVVPKKRPTNFTNGLIGTRSGSVFSR
jgi:hypothetical protein